jgi:hypothetical protein
MKAVSEIDVVLAIKKYGSFERRFVLEHHLSSFKQPHKNIYHRVLRE